ncbi:branched-chain amino acid ABC transporter permease [Dactylosporangium maewongense]|uniref:Branched-chain amino acid ABC transporter permease n=1 Tax=Dactylosporangium maewongense TaxID=634393 RepID=A0ABN2DGZ0_9ACTN
MLSSYWLFIVGQGLFYVLACLGLFLLYGRCGQLSLAHAASMGVGAYVGVVSVNNGVLPAVSLVLSIAAALLFGALQAGPAMRLSGLRFAVVTLAFGFLFNWIIENTPSITGGTQGLSAPSIEIAGLALLDPDDALWAGLVLAYLGTLLTTRIARTRAGLRMVAIRDSIEAARSVGINVAKTKVLAFLLGSAFAGTSGWLIAFSSGFISAVDFNLFASSYLLIAVLLGGANSVAGAWIGAAYIVLVPRLFSAVGLSESYPLLGGLMLIIVALLAPDGIVGQISTVRQRLGSLRFRRPSPPTQETETAA